MSVAENGPITVLPADRTIAAAIAERFTVTSSNGTKLAAYAFLNHDHALPSLLFAHANGFNAGCYVPFLQILSSRFNIFAYDNRGHGASEAPDPEIPKSYGMLRFGEDLEAVTEAVRKRTGKDAALHFASHSVGGMGLFVWLGSTGLKPFVSATMFEPPLHPKRDISTPPTRTGANSFIRWAAKRRVYFSGPEDFRDECRKFATYQNIAPEMMDALVTSGIRPTSDGKSYELRCKGIVESQIYTQVPQTPVIEIGARMRIPTRIFHGDPSLTNGFNPLQASLCEIGERLEQGETRMMAGQRHLMVLEAPERCAGEVFAHALDQGK